MATIYAKTQAIAACDPFVYDMNALKEAYNQEFRNYAVDAYVDNVRQIRGTFSNHLIVDVSVGTDSPISTAVAALIIYILGLTATTVALVILMSAGVSFREGIFGAPPAEAKFYTPDGKEFDTLIEYVTYMQNVYNPTQGMLYTCMYCAQGFATEAERDAHQAECPWKEGPPYPPPEETPEWVPWVAATVIVVAISGLVIVLLPRVLPKEYG